MDLKKFDFYIFVQIDKARRS